MRRQEDSAHDNLERPTALSLTIEDQADVCVLERKEVELSRPGQRKCTPSDFNFNPPVGSGGVRGRGQPSRSLRAQLDLKRDNKRVHPTTEETRKDAPYWRRATGFWRGVASLATSRETIFVIPSS
jgi:hypothetical protein